MADSKHQADLAEDMDRLQLMLERLVVPHAEKSVLAADSKELAVLNVACGACDEAEALTDFFARLKQGRGKLLPKRKQSRSNDSPKASQPAVHLVGTDVRERELDLARERFRSDADRSFEFIHGDASKLSQHKALREAFDVVFFRHQNLYHGRNLWRKIFEQGLEKLNDDGLLVITSYFDREHTLALEAFSELGAEVIATARNEHSRELPAVAGKSVDRHVAVLRKKRA